MLSLSNTIELTICAIMKMCNILWRDGIYVHVCWSTHLWMCMGDCFFFFKLLFSFFFTVYYLLSELMNCLLVDMGRRVKSLKSLNFFSALSNPLAKLGHVIFVCMLVIIQSDMYHNKVFEMGKKVLKLTGFKFLWWFWLLMMINKIIEADWLHIPC